MPLLTLPLLYALLVSTPFRSGAEAADGGNNNGVAAAASSRKSGSPSSPWGNYDGVGGLRDGHYCVNDYSAPTSFDSTRGYWAGLTWSSSSPAPHAFNFTALDHILTQAAAKDRYVEINALVGQCAPTWLYDASVGVTPLIVNWKPSTSCVPPLCVPAGTYDCARNDGTGCGCDGVYPCNQTFPDYLSPIYNAHLQEWIQATRDHLVGLPAAISSRILSVQVNVGSTGDGTFWHGRLYPDQREMGFQEMNDNATIQADYFLRIKKLYIDIYSQGLSKDGAGDEVPYIPLLFNGLAKGDPRVFAAVNASIFGTRGYMIKAGSVSHSYSTSGEMDTYGLDAIIRTPLAKYNGQNVYVRTRGETTLSAFADYIYNQYWAPWALSNWNIAYGMDTWQNNTLLQADERIEPVLAWFSHYAGLRKETAATEAPGAFAMLRDGLSADDTERFPEATFGVNSKSNYQRCSSVLTYYENATRFPPRNDLPAPSACGCGRKKTPHKTANGSVVSVGLNDACYRVWPGNYERFLTQLDVDSTSFGVWRVGPKDEIFGRYARVVAQKGGSSTGTLFFKVTDNVFESTSAKYARVVYFNEQGSDRSWSLWYSAKGGKCVSAGSVTNGAGNQSNLRHWVEARFKLKDAELGTGHGSCQGGADITVVDSTKSLPAKAEAVMESAEKSACSSRSQWNENTLINGSEEYLNKIINITTEECCSRCASFANQCKVWNWKMLHDKSRVCMLRPKADVYNKTYAKNWISGGAPGAPAPAPGPTPPAPAPPNPPLPTGPVGYGSPTVFNLVDVSKEAFDFVLSPWMQNVV